MMDSNVCFTTSLIRSGKILCSSIFASWGFWYSEVVPQEVTPFFQLTQNIVHYHASWRRFISYLEYKARLYGRKLIKVNPFYPSSKLCSVCGYKNESLKLSDRKWKCPKCGTGHDRDYNATLNLLKEGLKLIKGSLTLRAVGLGQPELTPVESAIALVEAGSSSF